MFWNNNENNPDKENLCISVESEAWFIVDQPNLSSKWKNAEDLDYKSESEIRGQFLGSLLKRYAKGEINLRNIKMRGRLRNVTSRSFTLDKEARLVYDRISKGTKTAIISALLLSWIQEQDSQKIVLSLYLSKSEKGLISTIKEELNLRDSSHNCSENDIIRIALLALKNLDYPNIINLRKKLEE